MSCNVTLPVGLLFFTVLPNRKNFEQPGYVGVQLRSYFYFSTSISIQTNFLNKLQALPKTRVSLNVVTGGSVILVVLHCTTLRKLDFCLQ